MEEEHDHSRTPPVPPPPSSFSSSSSLPSPHFHEVPETNLTDSHTQQPNYNNPRNVFYRFNFSVINSAVSDNIYNIAWPCLVVLITFWLSASIFLSMKFYGSYSLQLGPNCSWLITPNELFVQSIQAQQIEGTPGPMIYGFVVNPVLDVETTWNETHSASVQPKFHKEWIYYLNEGSKLNIAYDAKTLSSFPLTLVIVQGEENLNKWAKDPSYPNATLSWNLINGSGRIEQKITTSANYYIALWNANSDSFKVELNFTIKALLYNITQAYFRCSLYNQVCSFSLMLLRNNHIVLTSPGPEQAKNDDGWYVRLSYGPRWFTYILITGVLGIMGFLVLRFYKMIRQNNGHSIRRIQRGVTVENNEESLILSKDDDLSSWGSCNDYDSNNEVDLEEANDKKLCVICFDSQRDCFFLPCGHSATCFTCGSRIAEEVGSCPVCQKMLKKVRKIISV